MLEIPWPLLLGPYALTVGLVLLVALMLRGDLVPKNLVPRTDYERAITLAEDGNAANKKLAEAVEERNRQEAEESRMRAAIVAAVAEAQKKRNE